MKTHHKLAYTHTGGANIYKWMNKVLIVMIKWKDFWAGISTIEKNKDKHRWTNHRSCLDRQ